MLRLLCWIVLACLTVTGPAAALSSGDWEREFSQGRTAFQMGHYTRAERHLTAALELADAFPEADERRVDTIRLYAHVLRVKGETQESERLFREVLALREAGDDEQALSNAAYDLGALYVRLERPDEARPLLERSLEIRRRLLGERNLAVAASRNALAELDHQEGQLERAETAYLEILELLGSLGTVGLRGAGPTQNNLARLYRDMGRPEDAERFHRMAITMTRRAAGSGSVLVARFSRDLADLYTAQERFGEAEPLYESALEVFRSNLDETNFEVRDTLDAYAKMLEQAGRDERAARLRAEADALRVGQGVDR